MLTYAVEVSGVIGLAVLCVGLPVTAAKLGIEALWRRSRRLRPTPRSCSTG